MFLNLLINCYVLIELTCQDKYKKIELKLKQKYARFVNTAVLVKLRKDIDSADQQVD